MQYTHVWLSHDSKVVALDGEDLELRSVHQHFPSIPSTTESSPVIQQPCHDLSAPLRNLWPVPRGLAGHTVFGNVISRPGRKRHVGKWRRNVGLETD